MSLEVPEDDLEQFKARLNYHLFNVLKHYKSTPNQEFSFYGSAVVSLLIIEIFGQNATPVTDQELMDILSKNRTYQ